MKSILEAKGLSFCYPGTGKPVLSGISFSIQSGERVGLTAPSGIGKTTLCKILAGYEKPSRGAVLLNGRPIADYRGYCPVQLVWQHPEQAVNPRMPMGEVLAEGGGVSPEVMAGLGIEPSWLSRFPSELSGGELQRFCIARALNNRTRFLLADEITTMLDLVTQSQIWHFLLKETARQGIGLLAVSHVPSLLAQVCSRIIQLPVG